MRLIDADKLENDIVENITVKAVSRMLAITQGQPTVKAIPKAWIENKLKCCDNINAEIFVKSLIREWEKENETD